MIKILIVDDKVNFVETLTMLLEDVPDMEVTGRAFSGRDTIDLVGKNYYDIVLLDLSLPDVDGLEVVRVLKLHYVSGPPVLVLSGYTDEECGVDAIRAGAAGYLMKTKVIRELIPAIRQVTAGNTYMSVSIAKELAELQ